MVSVTWLENSTATPTIGQRPQFGLGGQGAGGVEALERLVAQQHRRRWRTAATNESFLRMPCENWCTGSSVRPASPSAVEQRVARARGPAGVEAADRGDEARYSSADSSS